MAVPRREYNGWIEPNGRIHYARYLCHNDWAHDYLRKGRYKDILDYDELLDQYESDTEYLHHLGWIRLLTWADGNTQAIGSTYDWEVLDDTVDPSTTARQRETLRVWCIDHNVRYDSLFENH